MAAPSLWMDAAFAMESDPDFVVLVDELQQHEDLASDGSDIEMISAFLDEMENGRSCESVWPNSQQRPDPHATTAPKLPTRKKKISSTERRKQEKALLLEGLAQLQLQVQGIKTEQQQDHWAKIIQLVLQRQRERFETQRILDENFLVWLALTREKDFAGKVAKLLDQLSAPMKALIYSDIGSGLRNHTAQDMALFETLRRNVNNNYTLLARAWEHDSVPMATNEALDVYASPNGNAITFKLARFFPFDVAMISDTFWRVAQSGFQPGSFKTITSLDSDLLAIKEQLTVHPAGHNGVTLCIRAVTKRIVRKNYSVFMWETVCDWPTPSGTPTNRTRESGWVLVRRATTTSTGAVSVVQALMKMTLVETGMDWTEPMQKSGPLVKLYSQHGILSRIQHLENCLIDYAV